jgi:hypothetical protein
MPGVVFKIWGGVQSVRSQDDDKCCLQNEVRLRGWGGDERKGLLIQKWLLATRQPVQQ